MDLESVIYERYFSLLIKCYKVNDRRSSLFVLRNNVLNGSRVAYYRCFFPTNRDFMVYSVLPIYKLSPSHKHLHLIDNRLQW